MEKKDVFLKKIIAQMTNTLNTQSDILDGILENENIREKVIKKFNINANDINLKNATQDTDIITMIETNDEYKNKIIEYVRQLYKEQFNKVEKVFESYKTKIADKEKENNELEKDNIAAKERFKEITEKNERLKTEVQELELEFKELEAKNKVRRDKRNELEKENLSKEKEYNNLRAEVELLERKKSMLSDEIQNIKPMYEKLKAQTMEDLKNILNIEKENLSKEKDYLKNDIDELKLQKKELNDSIIQIQDKDQNLNKKEMDLETLEQGLKLEKEKLESERERLDFLKQKIKDYETEVILNLKDNYEKEIAQLKEIIEITKENNLDLVAKNNRLEALCEDSLEKEEMKEKINSLLDQKKNLEDKLFGKNEERATKIQQLTDENQALKNLNEDLMKEKVELETRNFKLREYELNYEQKLQNIKDFEMNKEDLYRLIEKKDEQIAELKGRGMSEEAKKQVIEQAYFSEEELLQRDEFIEETKWLEEVIEKIKEVGFVFNSRLLYAFHTSLKISDWSSLSILAGVSGTGKSELPKLYSRYGGLNFVSLAVQPNWDSPHSLFGYYNSLEGKFNATSLLKILYQAQENVENSINDYLTIVLLDEMNLAHVELYFSELLSKLESLRGKEDGEILEIDIAENKPYEITLNNSVMWVGTMNEDETTKSLSDKVIDRGNLISFPKPNKLITRSSLKELDPAKKLSKRNWDNWKWSEDKIEKLEKKLEELKNVVEDINRALEGSGRAIGHRVWQSIESYVKNYPLVLKNLEDEKELNKYIQIAFEDALVQKLIPKLRGLETSGDIRTKCLDKIKGIIEQKANGILEDFEMALNNPYGVFVWTSSTYLEKDI